jgi:ATP-dependent DNA helicase RecG
VAIDVVDITDDQAEHIVGLEEGNFLDLKAIDIAPGKLTRSMSAFANSDGGELFIGIAEHKPTSSVDWAGFTNQEAANGHIQAFEDLFPLGGDFRYEFLKAPGKNGLVLHATILKTTGIKLASDGKVYVRRGAQNAPVPEGARMEQLRRTKGIVSYESETVANADAAEIANSTAIIGFVLDVIPEREPEHWLRQQKLLIAGKPTVGGLVLFSDEPQVHVPKAAVKIYRYATSDAAGSRDTLVRDPITVEGHLYKQIKDAVEITTAEIEGIQTMGPTGLEDVQYPPETLHEIITNAVLHRDYASADDVHVRIFDNRVEVESPGRLPAHITTDNILDERFARNPTLVRLINKHPDPPNKDVGEGLNTAFAAMKKLQLRDPEIIERDQSVLVLIRHERLASPEKIILDYVDANGSINNPKARDLTSIDSEYKVRRILKSLTDAGELEQTGRTTATSYRRPTTTSPN